MGIGQIPQVGLRVEGAESPSLNEAAERLNAEFPNSVQTFLQNNCLDCHGSESPEASLDLSTIQSPEDVANGFEIWQRVLERVEAEEMPPPDAGDLPDSEQRKKFVRWGKDFRAQLAHERKGDPGIVLVRRLNNAEYNYTIRDLTGVDLQPTKEFPIDPANEAGFDNTGESLSMTPALLEKYLQAARMVADHLVLHPDGFQFATHPAVTDTDRDKYCVRRIISFYERQPTDLADYFHAAWLYEHRNAMGSPDSTIEQIAAWSQVSPKYLETVWQLLTDGEQNWGPIQELRNGFAALPEPGDQDVSQFSKQCAALRDRVMATRQKLTFEFENLRVRGMHAGSQTLVLWKDRQYASHRRTLNRDALQVADEEAQSGESSPGSKGDAITLSADPAEQAAQIEALERFCSIFPDAFLVSERRRMYLDADETRNEAGRLLSAGFHSMMGYFRDDQPLYELILDENQQQELDTLWKELDFIASAPRRQYSGFLWFERTDSRFMLNEEFDFARAEDRHAASEEMIQRLSEVYLAKALRQGADDVDVEAITRYFNDINASIRWVDQARLAAEPVHLQSLVEFAERAARRPLSDAEREDIVSFYHLLREQDGLDHEEAIRDSVVAILMSPEFCYRLDLAGTDPGVQPLDEFDLASRLSYFLWSSMPDRKLLELAAAGKLSEPEVLKAQTRRMLHDPRARALAVEFGGNWLDYRRFEQHNSVDRNRFPEFNDDLRQAMFEEPVRFLLDVMQQDRSVLDLLYGDATFVNPVLAKHYGIPYPLEDSTDWVRIENASEYGRGGLLPMAVFLTKNAPGLRTSPVKRGFWVVKRLLGEHIPAPPPDVPELPSDESKLGEQSLRDVLASHRAHPSCSVCHDRFDSIGLVFENFGPVGELRETDLGGHAVDLEAMFPNGQTGEGLAGLKDYLQSERQQDFLNNMTRKLLAYALGRGLLPSDDALLQEMQTELVDREYRFEGLMESIVTSRQFLTQRGHDQLAGE